MLGLLTGVDPIQLALDPVEQRQPIARRLVPDVVDQARKAVDGEQVRADLARQHAACHGEVLTRRLGHHGAARGHGGDCAHRVHRPSAISGKTSR
jgi:hypothetical protein